MPPSRRAVDNAVLDNIFVQVPMNLIFAGSGEFGLPTLQGLLAVGHHLAHVYSQPDRPAGRGKHLTPTPISSFAIAHQLPLSRTANLNAENLPRADLLLVIAFGQKIAPHIIDHCRLGAVNLHASRLPRHRGAAPINHAILAGDATTGNSIIRLAQKMDAGAILAQSELTIGKVETAGELHDRLANDGSALMLRAIAELESGTHTEMPQNESKATLAPKLSRQSAQIDWSQPADNISRQIRAFWPWPGCRVRICNPEGDEIGSASLVRARPAPGGPVSAGTVDSQGHIAAANASAVEILELQPEGKRPMTLDAYRNGHPWHAGLRVQSI